ncbi:SBBP repeat-containing protein [Methanospirillum hungatei]|uniref:SBBP repeat-containing protein n=1 Tax=Methanospirillum hungatei TaxID=2203 RepID=UPI0026EFA1BE|nr:SBBP repeat-containing protein [Methanospirillum hungatei]MCA1915754.1 IPT/TIG domain-containing protein [Methanospirillum hungatei]
MNAAGNALVYSTYLGSWDNDEGQGIAVDAIGNVYVTGATKSTDFPTTPGAYQTKLRGMMDAFVTKCSFPAAPTITSITPTSGYYNAPVQVTITGTNFASGTNTVRLTRSGQSDITATNVNRNSATQITCTLPITGKAVGDWNVVLTTGGQTVTKSNGFTVAGAAQDSIGVFRGRTWYLDYNGNGVWNGPSTDRQYTFGLVGDVPVSGDWDKDGRTSIGVFRWSTRTWYLDYNGKGVWNGPSTDRQYKFGLTGDIPITGKWSGTSGTPSIQAVEVTNVTNPETGNKVPDVTKPVAKVPKIEIPVQSNSVIRPVTPGAVPSNKNPIVSGGLEFSEILKRKFS